MQAEALATAQAKEDLRKLMLSNEANKELKEQQRLADQALDRKYAREYTQKLNQEEKVSQTASFIEHTGLGPATDSGRKDW